MILMRNAYLFHLPPTIMEVAYLFMSHLTDSVHIAILLSKRFSELE